MLAIENGALTMPIGIDYAQRIGRTLSEDYGILADWLADQACQKYRAGRDIAGRATEDAANHYAKLAGDVRWLVCDEKLPPF